MSNPDSPPAIRRRAPIPKELCPMALSADILGDKWTLLILREAFYGVVRYDDMLVDTGAPRSMLTDRLAKLVDRGLMRREPYQEPGARMRHGYVLTEAGLALGVTLIALSQWGEDHLQQNASPVQFVEKDGQMPVRAALVTESGRTADLKDVRIRIKDRPAKAQGRQSDGQKP